MGMASEMLPIILYSLLAILVVVVIVLIVRLIKILAKVDGLVEDIANKSRKLDGVFNFVDTTTDTLNLMSDKIANLVVNGVTSFFKRKKKGNDEDE